LSLRLAIIRQVPGRNNLLLLRELLSVAPPARRRSAVPNASVSVFRLAYSQPDFAAAVGARIDELDLRHAPMGLDVSHIHRQQPYATGAKNCHVLNFVVLDVGGHVGSPSWEAR
jgi:hypothetical protein